MKMQIMKKLVFAAFAAAVLSSALLAQDAAKFNIIPKPQSVTAGSGHFTLDQKTKIVAQDEPGRISAGILNDLLMERYGFKLEYTEQDVTANALRFSTTAVRTTDPRQSETYSLLIGPQQIEILATETGMFYGIRTLMQILPAKYSGAVKIPTVEINDVPRFQYRGMHLDVSRHFMPVEFVKKYIDLMSQYKLNRFHWHLTDDQGWRIEIKKYPKLTEVGSKRPESHEGRYSTTFKGDGRPVEGFYTQEQIKDVVRYAKQRHVTIIPEIELPGHASAALAAYPELGAECAPPGYEFEVKKTWGIFKEVFCPTEKTFEFLEGVLSETIELFPDSPYIHIGGDEVLKDFWKDSAFVQELKKRENLKDEHEVQSYFVRRMEKFVNSKGKKIIGWDEILEGGIAPNATVMSWRGMKGGIEAAKANHDVIMTPTDFVYLDYGQGDPEFEPLNIGGYVPLSKTYSMDPVPAELTAAEAEHIIGAQANIWTEYLETPSAVEYMAFPRMLALAEVTWSPQDARDFADFRQRLLAHLPRLDMQNVNYRIPEPGGLENIVTTKERLSIELKPAPGTVVIYTTDGSTPNVKTSEQYREPIEISVKKGEAKTLKTIVVNAAGRQSVVYAATIFNGKMREPDETTADKPGLNYNLVVRGDETGSEKGETRSILLTQFDKKFDTKQPFDIQFDAYLKIPADGVYELQVDSTWDAAVVLDGRMIIDDAGTKERKIRSAIVPFKAGLHKISLRYNHRGGGIVPHFRFRYGIKGQGLRQAWGGEFVH